MRKLQCLARFCYYANRTACNTSNLLRTALYDFHIENGGKMVPFAGYAMPVQYSTKGIIDSHLHTRTNASIFDVSHMLQVSVKGKNAVEFIELLTPSDVASMKPGNSCYSLLLTEKSTIIDDLIITKISNDHLYLVSNASRAERDINHFFSFASQFDVSIEKLPLSIIAVQGPASAEALSQTLSLNVTKMPFMTSQEFQGFGRVTRCGYTGEDGFELSVPNSTVLDLTQKLLKHKSVELSGLGARDTLRLEAGLCLYGNDIDETTTLMEANLAWVVPKSRRVSGNFIGSEIVKKELSEGVTRKRVGLKIQSAPARSGALVNDLDGNKIGTISSGCPSPTLKENIAMAYVSKSFSKLNSEVKIQVRNKTFDAKVCKMPFVPQKYYKET